MSNRQQSFPGPDDITRITLPNGITVLVRTNFNSPSVVIGGHLACGSLFDTDEKSGLADFTASGLMRGTETRTFQQIFDALESVGAALSFGAGAHNTGFSGRSLIEDLPLMLELLADVLRHPVFPAEQIERLRAQFLTSLAQRAQDTAEMASITFDQIVFKGHPYARPEDGWPETIRAIQRDRPGRFPPALLRTTRDGNRPRRCNRAENCHRTGYGSPWRLDQRRSNEPASPATATNP